MTTSSPHASENRGTREKRRRPARPLGEKLGEGLFELAARYDLLARSLELVERGNEQLGHETTAVITKRADSRRERRRL